MRLLLFLVALPLFATRTAIPIAEERYGVSECCDYPTGPTYPGDWPMPLPNPIPIPEPPRTELPTDPDPRNGLPTDCPEPMSYALIGLGLIVGIRRKR